MSSQSDSGIPLLHAPSGVGYRLIELPAELVSLMESDNPPVLTLTSSPTAALLKTHDKTYSLRQKNTSNALILLAPGDGTAASAGTDGGGSHDDDDPFASQPSPPAAALSAVATVHETIELVVETEGAAAPASAARGKWHEKFSRSR